MIHIYDLCGLHELCRFVSSKIVLEKMIYHKIHICDLCHPHEFYGCASSNFQVVKMIYHMIWICDLCGLHVLRRCLSSKIVQEKMSYYKFHICECYGMYMNLFRCLIIIIMICNVVFFKSTFLQPYLVLANSNLCDQQVLSLL